jgi:hypothetical protein
LARRLAEVEQIATPTLMIQGADDRCDEPSELTFQLGDELLVARPGELAFAPGGVPHTLANRGTASVRFLIVCTPAGFEREFARRAAARAGVDPPERATQPLPEVTVVGPRIGESDADPR